MGRLIAAEYFEVHTISEVGNPPRLITDEVKDNSMPEVSKTPAYYLSVTMQELIKKDAAYLNSGSAS